MGLKTQQFTISGLYGAIGYNIETTDNLLFQPNLRLGLANRAEAMYTLYLNANVFGTQVNASQDYSNSESGMTLGIMLPIVYKLESVNFFKLEAELSNTNNVSAPCKPDVNAL